VINRPDGAEPQPPSMADLRARIRAWRDEWDGRAKGRRRGFIEFGKWTAILVPIAVLLLTVQIVVCPYCSKLPAIPIFLIVLEIVVLAVALLILLRDLGPHSRRWAADRLRTEALRREEFLLLMRVGPYLTESDLPGLAATVDLRLAHITKEKTDPVTAIQLQEADQSRWCVALEDTPADRIAPLDSTAIPDYLQGRAHHQSDWYANNSRIEAAKDRKYDRFARFVLIGALLVALLHLIALIATGAKEHSIGQLILGIVAVGLPPVGGAAVALQSFFQARRLSRSYEYHAQALTALVSALNRLLEVQPELSTQERQRIQHNARRLVLQIEELLAYELIQWYSVVRPDRPPIQ